MISCESLVSEIKIHTQFSDYFKLKLCREYGWSLDYYEGAIEEYRRFLYLIMLQKQKQQNHMLAPCFCVDIVWHLHILHTRDYQEMCTALGHFIHHYPNDQMRDIDKEYAATLALYEAEYHELPYLWTRVLESQNFIWVDKKMYSFVNKIDAYEGYGDIGFMLLLFLGALLVASCFDVLTWWFAIPIITVTFLVVYMFKPTYIEPTHHVRHSEPLYSEGFGG